MVLGLTGKYCAGKNLVADYLSRSGWSIIDEDRIGHQSLAANQGEIVEAFGREIEDADGNIDRRALGEIVFGDPAQLNRLESIVHPWMVRETKRLIDEGTEERFVINAAVLFKMGLHELCDSVIVVRSFVLLRVIRGRRRDGSSLRQIRKRLSAQRSLNRAPGGVDTISVWNNRSRIRLERNIIRQLGGRIEG